MHLKKNDLLFRGIDYPPEELSAKSVLKTNNSERILWCTTEEDVAKTYIPDWGLLAYVGIGWDENDSPRPDDSIITSLMEAAGGRVEIHSREWDISKATLKPHLVTNGTFGRPTSWSQSPRTTWRDIHALLESLGYENTRAERTVKIKTRCRNGRCDEIMPKNSRLRGTLVTFRCKEPLHGINRASGDLLDPDYHHAAQWAKETPKDFFTINDYCQTENHGNVGHTSYALLPSALPKLEVVSICEAYHHEWAPDHWHSPKTEPKCESSSSQTSTSDQIGMSGHPNKMPA